jgi:hypothetical protein
VQVLSVRLSVNMRNCEINHTRDQMLVALGSAVKSFQSALPKEPKISLVNDHQKALYSEASSEKCRNPGLTAQK